MATSELASTRVPSSPRAPARVTDRGRVWSGLPVAIGLLLLAAILYAAFAHGAVTRSAGTRLELIVAGLTLAAALAWLWLGAIRLNAPRSAVAGAALLGAYACWSGASIIWSVAPDESWIEVNRVVTYLLVLVLGIAVGASHRRGLETVAKGYVVAALAVTVYALAQKLAPELHVSGVFNLNQTGPLPRLQEPLGYWNALALFLVLAAPLALALTADRTRSSAGRLGSAVALALILITVPLTYSRGGLLALAVVLAVGISFSGQRLRSTIWLLVVVLAALPAALVGLLVPELSAANVSLGTREWAGGVLAGVVLGGLLVLILCGRWLFTLEPRLQVSAARSRSLRRLAWGGVAGLLAAGLLALAVTPRGFTGNVTHLWDGFASTHTTSGYDPQRLLSAASENRWVWWKEAAAAFSARPWQGWGAGSFPVVHLLYRRDTLPVQQPHNVPLQFLAETGAVGAILGIGAFLLLVAGAVRVARSSPAGPERLLLGALMAAAIGYGVHCLYDWDWNIPALSLPVFLFLGVVSGRWERGRSSSVAGNRGQLRRRPVLRAWALAAVTAWLCLFALSIELPELAADKAGAAVVAASSASPAAVRAAQAEAALASQLDPLSDSGLLTQATVALHNSQLAHARVYLAQAVNRNPSDPQAWRLLALVDLRLGDRRWVSDLQRAVDLDPMGRYAQLVVARQLRGTSPSSSPTRYPVRVP